LRPAASLVEAGCVSISQAASGNLPPKLSNYFGKHVLEFSSHFLSCIFSHSACVGGVCAKAGTATAAAKLKAMTVSSDFMGFLRGYPAAIKRKPCRCVPLW
jgi:hypothetical protein